MAQKHPDRTEVTHSNDGDRLGVNQTVWEPWGAGGDGRSPLTDY